MKDLEQKLHTQFPESISKTIEVIATELEIYDEAGYYEQADLIEDSSVGAEPDTSSNDWLSNDYDDSDSGDMSYNACSSCGSCSND